MKAPLPDETLTDWLARGAQADEAACAALYAHFSPAIQRLTLGLLNDLADAEEVTQDTFVYAFRNLARYDSTKSAFSTWLFTIAISRSRNKRRRKWLALFPLEVLTGAALENAPREVEDALERRGIRRQVWAALQNLSPRLREAVALRFIAGMRYKEIGEALECNPKTAESRVRLGLEAMREMLAAQGLEAEWAELGAR
jgi:RNA polymerase sigma-70 factor (ECF subfamily)